MLFILEYMTYSKFTYFFCEIIFISKDMLYTNDKLLSFKLVLIFSSNSYLAFLAKFQ